MSKNRLKLTNEDLRDVFDFRKYLKMPERQYYCKIYGIVYADKDGTELFDTKEECIESSYLFLPYDFCCLCYC